MTETLSLLVHSVKLVMMIPLITFNGMRWVCDYVFILVWPSLLVISLEKSANHTSVMHGFYLSLLSFTDPMRFVRLPLIINCSLLCLWKDDNRSPWTSWDMFCCLCCPNDRISHSYLLSFSLSTYCVGLDCSDCDDSSFSSWWLGVGIPGTLAMPVLS